MTDFATKRLPQAPDLVAPDGSDIGFDYAEREFHADFFLSVSRA